METLILHSQDFATAQLVAKKIGADFQQKPTHFRFIAHNPVDLNSLRSEFKLDFNIIPKHFSFSQVALLMTDMDSTLINIECIDEIADFANLKTQVSSITERAMQGRIDFDDSLIERVALLKGLNVSVLEGVYKQKLRINSGGQALIQFLKHKNIKSGVVSGGFNYFTNRLADDIGLDYARANTLAVKNNTLTGKIKGDIINAQAKADFINELCKKYLISTSQVIAVGDGANDLAMMKIAGLSVAYHAKLVVSEYADIVINVGGLDKIIDLFDE